MMTDPTSMTTTVAGLRLTPEDAELLRDIARSYNLPPGAYLRKALYGQMLADLRQGVSE